MMGFSGSISLGSASSENTVNYLGTYAYILIFSSNIRYFNPIRNLYLPGP